MSHNIDQQTRLIEATIQQLLSGLPKTYIPFTEVEIWENKHIAFAQQLEAICDQDYNLMINADRLVTKFERHCLEIENLGEFCFFPDIVA
jgi:hypothetical protein